MGELKHWHAQEYEEAGENLTWQAGEYEAVPALCKDYGFFPLRKQILHWCLPKHSATI